MAKFTSPDEQKKNPAKTQGKFPAVGGSEQQTEGAQKETYMGQMLKKALSKKK